MSSRLHHFAVFTAVAGLFLVMAGGLVTSTGSGLAVPDWPLSYGQFFPPMVGGIFYEHGHRLIASSVGFLTVVLAFWIWRRETRASVRRAGFFTLAAVIVQGILGGITVLYLLPIPVSVTHACLGQIFFTLLVSLAFVTSPRWYRTPAGDLADTGHSLSLWSYALTLVVFAQLVLGAVVRHTQAALAIPDFPLIFGGLLPPHWGGGVAIHFVHRLGGVLVAVVATLTFVRAFRQKRRDPLLAWIAGGVLTLVSVQILLGGLTVWTEKSVAAATAHQTVGASILALSVLAALWSRRRYGNPAETIRDFGELMKPRVTFMVCLTSLVGFYLGSFGPIRWSLLILSTIATALVAGGASALNQVMERDVDGQMRRTSKRPLPAGRLTPKKALSFGLVVTGLGLMLFYFCVNGLATLLAALAWGLYLFIYTPLKRKTPLCTAVGAVPGAIPPMIGWAAGAGNLSLGAWLLFGILFIWQLPHFLAIAWMYREDYARASLPMLPVVDPTGIRTSRQLFLFALALLPMGLLPFLLGVAGSFYFIGALILGAVFFGVCLTLILDHTYVRARRVLMASVLYLPLLLALMVADKV